MVCSWGLALLRHGPNLRIRVFLLTALLLFGLIFTILFWCGGLFPFSGFLLLWNLLSPFDYVFLFYSFLCFLGNYRFHSYFLGLIKLYFFTCMLTLKLIRNSTVPQGGRPLGNLNFNHPSIVHIVTQHFRSANSNSSSLNNLGSPLKEKNQIMNIKLGRGSGRTPGAPGLGVINLAGNWLMLAVTCPTKSSALFVTKCIKSGIFPFCLLQVY